MIHQLVSALRAVAAGLARALATARVKLRELGRSEPPASSWDGPPHLGRWRRRADPTVLPGAFGSGSRRPFGWYLEGVSTVVVESVPQLCRWLRGCEYVSDRELLGKADHWQHPVAFERLRRGDCEDHALWAWRKLRRLGLSATLVVGELGSQSHVWVVFVEAGTLHLLETTEKSGEMVLPAHQASEAYRPRYGVDGDLRIYFYDPSTEGPGTSGPRHAASP